MEWRAITVVSSLEFQCEYCASPREKKHASTDGPLLSLEVFSSAKVDEEVGRRRRTPPQAADPGSDGYDTLVLSLATGMGA